MLLTLHRIASRLQGVKPLTMLLVAAGLAGTLASLFAGGGAYAHWLEPSLILTLWGMLTFAYLQLFRQIPPPVLPHDTFLVRLGTRFLLLLYTLLALLVVIVAAVLLFMSLRLASIS